MFWALKYNRHTESAHNINQNGDYYIAQKPAKNKKDPLQLEWNIFTKTEQTALIRK